MDIALKTLTMFNDDPDLLKKVTTGDESCMAMTLKLEPNQVNKSVQKSKSTVKCNCVKEFDRNSQNSGKTNHGFCAMVTHQLTHRCSCVIFWPNHNRNHASTVFGPS